LRLDLSSILRNHIFSGRRRGHRWQKIRCELNGFMGLTEQTKFDLIAPNRLRRNRLWLSKSTIACCNTLIIIAILLFGSLDREFPMVELFHEWMQFKPHHTDRLTQEKQRNLLPSGSTGFRPFAVPVYILSRWQRYITGFTNISQTQDSPGFSNSSLGNSGSEVFIAPSLMVCADGYLSRCWKPRQHSLLLPLLLK
jgi:hypothetical protein